MSVRSTLFVAVLALAIPTLAGCPVPSALLPGTNTPPVIQDVAAMPKATSVRGEAITLTALAVDPEGQGMTYQWTATKGVLSASGGGTLAPSGATVVWKPSGANGAALEPGPVTVTVVVSDGASSALASVTLTVQADGTTTVGPVVIKRDVASPAPAASTAASASPTATSSSSRPSAPPTASAAPTLAPTPTAAPVATPTPTPVPTRLGVYELADYTVEPPDMLTFDNHEGGWEIVAKPGEVVSRNYHKIGGGGVTIMGEFKVKFDWTGPPNQARPGEVWPISATATLLELRNPLNYAGNVNGNVWGQYLWTDEAGNDASPRVAVGMDGSGDKLGTTVTKAATARVPAGGRDFDLAMWAQCGRTYRVVYHYKWKP